jgi:hypothetical protein
MSMDFTLTKYQELCCAVAGSRYSRASFSDYLEHHRHDNNTSFIILRHDIDRNIRCSLHMAQMERDYDIKGSYYFRMRKGTYMTDIIDHIASYGHEIGYHYETMDKAKGNVELAVELFGRELAEFRKRYEVKTVCAHGNPLTRHDNKDIWKKCQFSDFGLLGEPYLSLDYSKFAYFSESGRTWRNTKTQKMEGKDYVSSLSSEIQPGNTDELIQIIKEGKLPNICILAHPERWSKDWVSFTSRWLLDFAFSAGKWVIYMYRRNTLGS